MKGKIYSADYPYSTLATFENGYVYKDSLNPLENNLIIGRYDTNETGKRNIFVGSSTWSSKFIGTIQNDYAHMCQSSNKFDLYIRDDYIYNNERRIVAKFEGNPKEALAACMVCVHLDMVASTKSNTPIKGANSSSTTSDTDSDVTVGGIASCGCGTFLIGIVIIAFALYLGIRMAIAFWGELLIKSLQEINLPYFIFFFFPLIACYIGSFAITYKKANSSKFTEVIPDVISTLFTSVTVVSIIGGIATIVDIYAQDMSKLYIILVVFFVPLMYWIISIIPAIIVTLATWIAVKIKLA